jgi:hypothetical protein
MYQWKKKSRGEWSGERGRPSCSPASTIALLMEAVSISETSANFYQTKGRNIPEDNLRHEGVGLSR